jgi:hypothetical protein
MLGGCGGKGDVSKSPPPHSTLGTPTRAHATPGLARFVRSAGTSTTPRVAVPSHSHLAYPRASP